jgi:hypothetical protein
LVQFNAKSPDVPGGLDIAIDGDDVSISACKKDVDARHKGGHDELKRS